MKEQSLLIVTLGSNLEETVTRNHLPQGKETNWLGVDSRNQEDARRWWGQKQSWPVHMRTSQTPGGYMTLSLLHAALASLPGLLWIQPCSALSWRTKSRSIFHLRTLQRAEDRSKFSPDLIPWVDHSHSTLGNCCIGP